MTNVLCNIQLYIYTALALIKISDGTSTVVPDGRYSIHGAASPTHWAQSQMHIVHIDPARPIQNAMLMPTKEKSHRRGRERESRRYADELSTVAVAMHPGARSDRYSSAKNLPIASEQRRIG